MKSVSVTIHNWLKRCLPRCTAFPPPRDASCMRGVFSSLPPAACASSAMQGSTVRGWIYFSQNGGAPAIMLASTYSTSVFKGRRAPVLPHHRDDPPGMPAPPIPHQTNTCIRIAPGHCSPLEQNPPRCMGVDRHEPKTLKGHIEQLPFKTLGQLDTARSVL